jgi:hypothetical protein
VTIRAKLYAAIAMTVLGPLVTIGVALSAFAALGDRFDDVARRSDRRALALELKFAVTDVTAGRPRTGTTAGAAGRASSARAATSRGCCAARGAS